MPGEDQAYELLPTHEGSSFDHLDAPRKRSVIYRRLRGSWFKSKYLALLSGFLLFSSALLFTVDLFYLRGRNTVDSETKTHESLFSFLWPVGLPNRTDSWENENSKTMHALFKCVSDDSCRENQTSVVLLSSEHFANSIAGRVSGEDIWAMSVLVSLREMGYTAIFSPNNYELARTYRQYPDLVKIIIIEGARSRECFSDPKCIKTPTHPLGIPAWKMLSFHFWNGASNPLGNPWTLSPENYARISPGGNSMNNTYLGYSIERTCMHIPITPPSERPVQAYVLAKQLRYFYGKDFAWKDLSFADPPPTLPQPLSLVAGLADDMKDATLPVPEGITNLGKLNQTTFYENLGHSRVLIGIGNPFLSPSPYDALCMAVPFINPVLNWNRENPDDRSRWNTQHEGLKFENPPYVYNVKTDDKEGFWDAVKAAMDNPIERYIVPAMSMDSLNMRLGRIVEKDWKSQAEALLEERKATGEGELFEI